jgi:hypothetical protein
LSCSLNPLAALFGIRAAGKEKPGPESQPLRIRDKIPNVYDRGGEIPSGSLAFSLITRLGFDPILVASVLLLVVPLLFAGFGFGEARWERAFFFVELSGSEYVVLRVAGGDAILAAANRSGSSYRQEFRVQPLSELGTLTKESNLTLTPAGPNTD